MRNLVYVRWRDSSSTDAWQSSAAAFERCNTTNLECESVGFLMEASRDRVTMCMSRGLDLELIGDTLTIPREAVVQIKRLTLGSVVRVPKK